MKLSVIVPVYNVEKYLGKCLESLVDQTVSDYEIIVVNDGSPDGSQKIIDDYAARYPDKIVPIVKENGGVASARNLGISKARGEYLAFVDGDDYVAPDMYEKLIESIESSNADIVLCDTMQCYPDGSMQPYDSTSVINNDPLTASCSPCSKLFTRSVIGELRYPLGVWYEDLDFVSKAMLKAEKIASVREPLYFYVIHDGSIMHNTDSAKNLDMLKVLDDIAAEAHKYGCEDRMEYLVLIHLLWTSISRVAAQDNPEKKAVIRKMRSYVRERVPNLVKSPVFKTQSFKRRVIMFLNYYGMEDVAQFIFRLKKAL